MCYGDTYLFLYEWLGVYGTVKICTVKPVLSGHHWRIAKCPLKMNFGCGQIHILLKNIAGNNNK